MAKIKEVRVPDIGNFKDVAVIEVLVQAGQAIQAEQPIATLESDKAAMEVPAPESGTVQEVVTQVGDKVSQGDLLLMLNVAQSSESGEQNSRTANGGGRADQELSPPPSRAAPVSPEKSEPEPPRETAKQVPPQPSRIDDSAFVKAHASPAVRKFARELGVDLSKIGEGGGRKGRILKEDVQYYVKTELAKPRGGSQGGPALPEMPEVDFSQFGEIETRPLSRIQKISGQTLHRNWLLIPHVTQHDQADITELEAFRKSLADEAKRREIKLTPLAFLVKAVVAGLKEFPMFNASLAPDKENLILKKYFHIGFAVDTRDGLVVPVIRDVDQKGLFQVAGELAALSARAREGKLSPADMQGGCFTISSLGSLGGTAFTPIINAPEVAILGVSKAGTQPVWKDGEFVPRLLLPLSLSYDHRVIDGAQAVRFTTYLSFILSDVRRLLL